MLTEDALGVLVKPQRSNTSRWQCGQVVELKTFPKMRLKTCKIEASRRAKYVWMTLATVSIVLVLSEDSIVAHQLIMDGTMP